MSLPHDTITPIPSTLPEALPELWNTRYTEIDQNFDAVDTRLAATEAEITEARGGKTTVNARLVLLEKNSDYAGKRDKSVNATSDLTVQDNISVTDMRKIVNYAVTGDGWSHVMLPALSSISDDMVNSIITITNTGLADEGQIRIVPYGFPGAGTDTIYAHTDPVFYPRGCVYLERAASVVLMPNKAGNFWWLVNMSQPSLLARVAAVSLNLSANVAADGGINWNRKRGFLGFQVTKLTGSGAGTYKIDWQDSYWLGGYPEVYVQPVSSAALPVSARVQPIEYNATTGKYANSATIVTYQNGVKTDLEFNVLITVPTYNTYQP